MPGVISKPKVCKHICFNLIIETLIEQLVRVRKNGNSSLKNEVILFVKLITQ